MIAEDYFLLQQAGGSSTSTQMLQGPIRIVKHGTVVAQDQTHSFVDDTGPRRITGCSWFCAARDYREDRAGSEVVLDAIVEAGYQYVRMFRVLGYDRVDPNGPDIGDSGYFYRRGVSPVWGIDATNDFAQACRARGLRIQCTTGHQWNSDSERMQWERKMWTRAHVEGLSETFFVIEGDNEYWQNANGHNSDEQIALYGSLFTMIRGILSPAPFCACGAAENEAPELVRRSFTHSDVCEIHTSRDPEKTIKRVFSLWYNEGHIDMYGLPFVHGEPRPPIGPDAFMPAAEPGRLIGAYAMAQLTGGALTQFSGESVRGSSFQNSVMGPVNVLHAAGFREIPSLLGHLPHNVAESTHIRGGNIWWWMLPDGRFATVADELWGPSALSPPYPVKSHLKIGPYWSAVELHGAPQLYAGEGGALFIGEFA